MFNFRRKNKSHTLNQQNFIGDSALVLAAIQDGVIALDKNGNIKLINPSAELILGWQSGEALDLLFNSVLKITNNDGREFEEISNPIKLALNNFSHFSSRDFFLKTRNGKIIPIFLNINPVNNNNGIVIVFRSIANELKENREQAEFISTASHEMRTPVASIEGYLALALNPATATIDERARSYLNKAHQNTEHLGELFRDLLDITKAEDGRLKNEPRVIEVMDFSHNVWDGLKFKADEKGLEYIFYNPSTTGGERIVKPVYYINVDRDHLQEVLNNLFENAIKYTLSGQVKVKVEGDENSVIISVSDSGIGIPEEDIPHLFQKFYRVDNRETREIGGTGLGLYLSRKLAEAMGGSLTVSSEYQKGSTFTLKIPRLSNDIAKNLLEKQKIEDDRIKAEVLAKQTAKDNLEEQIKAYEIPADEIMVLEEKTVQPNLSQVSISPTNQIHSQPSIPVQQSSTPVNTNPNMPNLSDIENMRKEYIRKVRENYQNNR